MSADPSPTPTGYPNRLELMAQPSDARRAEVCRGCGQGSENLARLDAIAVTAYLQRRFASLLDNPERALRDRGPGRGTWSAMEPAAQVSDVLAGADRRLRALLGEEALPAVPAALDMQPSIRSAQTLSMVLATLSENVRRLTATIAGATTQDWRRPAPGDGSTAGQMVWLALHDATHHLEDAELLLDAASARATTLRPVTDITLR